MDPELSINRIKSIPASLLGSFFKAVISSAPIFSSSTVKSSTDRSFPSVPLREK